MKYAFLFGAALLMSSSAVAQHKHGHEKGPNGGEILEVAGVHAELVVSRTTLTINVMDETNKPVATGGYSGSALVVNGADRETVDLVPHEQNGLKGDAKKPIAPKATITILLKTAAGKTGQTKYVAHSD